MNDWSEPLIIAIDPGREKCGLAVLRGPEVRLRGLVPRPEIALTCRYLLGQFPGARVIVGNQTAGRAVGEQIRASCPDTPVELVGEAYTTIEAERLYCCDNPPGCWLCWLPASLRCLPRPVDDYAAVALAQRYLSTLTDPATSSNHGL